MKKLICAVTVPAVSSARAEAAVEPARHPRTARPWQTVIGACAIAGSASAVPTNDQLLYTAKTGVNSSALQIVDPATGHVTATYPEQFGLLISGMVYDPSTDILFGVTAFDGLFTVDRDFGIFSFVGDVDQTIAALAIHRTTFVLYGLDLQGNLYTVDKSTGALTIIGSASILFAHGLAFAVDGTLWACDTVGAGTSRLHMIDPETGQATFVGDIDRDFVVSLDFGPDGFLYGSDNGTDSLITINLQTALATTVGPYGTQFSHNAIAWAPEPDPGECLSVTSQEIVCHADGATFTVNVEGLNACTGGTTQVTFTASGGAVGEELCFTALVNDGGFCCSTEICVTIPDCTLMGRPSDLDGDGIVGIVDFLVLIAAWGSCSDCGNCPADFDGDCTVGILDLLMLLANWG